MLYLYISIICSVSVAALFKIIKKKGISIFPIIHFNYFLAVIFCLSFFKSSYYSISLYNYNLFTYILLGILLPILFLIFNRSIQDVGIIKTDIAQRFSLIIPILVSIFIWKQLFTINKILGLLLAFISIFLILYKKDNIKNSKNYIAPVFVLLGYGIVDVLFKKIATIQTISYTSSLLFIFTLAFFISTVLAFFITKKKDYSLQTIKWGITLGTLNFANIYTYISAHNILKNNPTIVFSTMNLGVIVLSTIVGYLIFKEKINILNTIGIIVALLSMYLIIFFN